MEFNEKEFKKMVKKSRLKSTSSVVGVSVLVISLFFLAIGGVFLTRYNYINLFNSESKKVKGLPNNYMRIVNQKDGFLGLLFDSSGGFEINHSKKEMIVYLDYYEKGELKKREEVLNIFAENNPNGISGSFYWGISENQTKLSTSFTSSNNYSMNSDYDLKSFGVTVEWMKGTPHVDGEMKKISEDKFLLYKFAYNENGEISGYIEQKEEFKKENIAQNDKLVLFYAEFK